MKKIKVLRGILLLFMGVSLCSCGYLDENLSAEENTEQKSSTEAKRYTVTYYNYDQTFLYSCEVYEGGTATYKGPTPTRESTEDYEYSFAGWNYKETNIKSNTSLTAQYVSSYIPSYLVTFLNYDGTQLYQTRVKRGKSANYEGDTPTRPDEDRCTYTFIGWDKPIDDIQSTTTVVAQYAFEKSGYSVTFLNYDDTLLDIQYTDYGLGVVYQGNTPERPSDGETSYVFNGWDQPLTNITDDIVVHAVYTTTTTKCKVIFKNYDDTTVYQTTVDYGQSATCPTTPTRASEGKYSYVFNGWDKDTSSVYRDMLVYATYNQEPRGLSEYFEVNYNETYLTATITNYYGSEEDVYVPSTITQSGITYAVKSISGSAFDYTNRIKRVYIDENVEVIGSNAFYNCYNLESLHLPRSLRSIESYAFYGTKLKDVEILENVESIDYNAFPQSSNLVISQANMHLKFVDNILYDYAKTTIYQSYGVKGDVVIDSGVKTISSNAFYEQAITSVTIPSTVKTIGNNAFSYTNIKFVKINNAACSIQSGAFSYCYSLESIDLGSSVVSIESDAFRYANITSITLPNTLTLLSSSAFNSCSNLEQFFGAESNTFYPVKNGVVYTQSFGAIHIVPNAFKGVLYIPKNVSDISVITTYSGRVNDIEIDSSNTYLLYYKGGVYNKQTMELIYLMPNVTNLELHPDTLSLKDSICSERSSLRSVTFNSKLRVIGESAFYNCYIATFNELPNSITQINSSAFYSCSSLKVAKIGNNCTFIGNDAFNNSGLTTLTLGSNVSQIGNYAFANTYIDSVSLPNDLSSLGTYSFYNCGSLVSATFGSGLTSLPTYAFRNCYRLSNLTLPTSLKSIGTYCFEYCSSLKNVSFPSSLTSIGTSAFNNSGLSQVLLSNTSISSLPDYAFSNCGYLTSISLPSTLKSIGSNCFAYCYALSSITLPSSVTSLGDSCFYNCTALTSVSLPSSLTTLGSSCFYGCSSLRSISLPVSLTTIGSSCFVRCKGLTSINLPSSLTSISSNAFSESNIQSVTTSISLSQIQNYAFSSTPLESVTFNSNSLTINSYAFNYCQNLRSIDFGSYTTTCNNYSFYGLNNLDVDASRGTVTFNSYSFNNSAISNIYVGDKVNIKSSAFNSIGNMFVAAGIAKSKIASNFASSVQNLYSYETDPSKFGFSFSSSIVKHIYFYANSQPLDNDHAYWHMVNDVPTIWPAYVPEVTD